MTRICAIETVLALIATGAFVASPLRYTPPRYVAVISTHSVPVKAAGTQARVNAPKPISAADARVAPPEPTGFRHRDVALWR